MNWLQNFLMDKTVVAEAVSGERRSYSALVNDLRQALAGHGYAEKSLGVLDKREVLLFSPRYTGDRKRVLLLAGMHGNEPAGPWAILKFCQDHPGLLDHVCVSILPVINLYGFRTDHHDSKNGKWVNWFINEDGSDRDPDSPENALVRSHFDELGLLARDGLMNLHEDDDAEGFYAYVLGDIKSDAVRAIQAAGLKYFKYKRDGRYEGNGSYVVEKGLVDNYHDYTFDDAMQRRFGIPLTVTTETPSKSGVVAFVDRVTAASEMILGFVLGVGGKAT